MHLLQPVSPQLPAGMPGHLLTPPSLVAHPLSEPCRVSRIRPDDSQPGQFFLQPVSQESLRAVTVVHSLAAWTWTPSTSPFVSTSRWRFLPASIFLGLPEEIALPQGPHLITSGS